jgi:plastocyanin
MVRKVILGMFVTSMVFLVPSTVLAKAQPAQGGANTVNATETGGGSNFVFQPNNITIKTGQTVTFKNTGTAPHTATADDGSFDKTPLNPGDSYTTPAFTKPGTYTYKCTYHASLGMTGTIVVSGASVPGGVSTTPTSTASATATASASASPVPTGTAAFGISPTPTPTAPPSQKYFPKIAGAVVVLALLGIVAGYVKTARKLHDKGS